MRNGMYLCVVSLFKCYNLREKSGSVFLQVSVFTCVGAGLYVTKCACVTDLWGMFFLWVFNGEGRKEGIDLPEIEKIALIKGSRRERVDDSEE